VVELEVKPMATLEEKIRQLPLEFQQEAEDFVDFLAEVFTEAEEGETTP
jgi:hypothetical protein